MKTQQITGSHETYSCRPDLHFSRDMMHLSAK